MDLLIFYVVHTYFTMIISLIGNGLLIYLIFKKTPLPMKPYSHVLLQTCVIDIFKSIVCGFVLFELGTSHGNIYIKNAAPWIPINDYFPCLATWLYLSALACVFWSMFVQALFRFYHIVKYQTLSPFKTWLLQFFIFFFAAAINFDYSLSFCRNNENNKNENTNNNWDSKPGVRSQPLLNIHMFLYTTTIVIVSILCNCIFMFCNYQVIKKLRSSASIYSKQTLKMHKEFNRKSLFQIITPLLSCINLLVLIGAIHSKYTEDTGLLLVGLMPFQYLPVLNPLITIFTIKSYRKIFLRCNKKEASTTAFSTYGKNNRYQLNDIKI